jgi:glycerate 2-kinase
VPSESSVLAAEALLQAAREAPQDAVVFALISGGASALASAPAHDITLADKRAVTRLLLQSGAAIQELNCVRKHLSRLKGG